MRITDDRYHREQQRISLALRMIKHEARTATIQGWTGLTADRIRKLHRQYVFQEDAESRRHRGKPPRQSAYFLRNADLRRQSSALGGLFTLIGLLRADGPNGGSLDATPWTQLFCDAYEAYLDLRLGSDITFEHAAYLLEALQVKTDLRPGCCPTCHSFTIIDTQRRMAPHCALCEDAALDDEELRVIAETSTAPREVRRARIGTKRRHATPSSTHLRRPLR